MDTFLEKNSEEIKNTLNYLATNISDCISKKTADIEDVPNIEHIIYENLIEPFKAIIRKYASKVDDDIYTLNDASELKVILDNLVDCFNNSIINGLGETLGSEKKINALIERIKNISYLYISDIENIFKKYVKSPQDIETINYKCDFKGINSFLESVANGKIVKKGKKHVYIDANDKEYKLINKEVIDNNVKCEYGNGNDTVNIDMDITKNNEGKIVKFVNKYVYKDKYVLVIGVPTSFIINMIDKDSNDYIYVCKTIHNSKYMIDIRNVNFTEEKYSEVLDDEHQEYALDILKRRFKNIYKTLMNDVDFEILVEDIKDGIKQDEKDEIIKELKKELKEKNKLIKELQAKLKR